MNKYITAAALTFLLTTAALAQNGLMINPKRIILDDRNRVGDITLFNSNSDSASYVISLTHLEMLETGGFFEVPDSVHTYDSTYCDKDVRFFPEEVTLPPHQSQAIHVRFMKPMGLAPGEYRSHLYFRALEAAAPIEQQVQDSAKHTISLILRPIFGISIPLIVRNGNLATHETLDSGSYTFTPTDTDGTGIAYANLNRAGNESCYGSLLVFFKDNDGHESQVGVVHGLAVYTNLTMRKVEVTYHLPKGVNPKTGTLRMEYLTGPDGEKEELQASTNLAMK